MMDLWTNHSWIFMSKGNFSDQLTSYFLYLSCTFRPFRLTSVIARAHVSTRANLSAHAICRTHEKSYSAEKVLFIEYSSFNPLFMFTSAIFE